MSGEGVPAARWTIHGERVVDDTRRLRLSVADVELPDGVRFEQYVLRMPPAAIAVVLDEAGDRVLMIRRHRFVIDRVVWELPGGYVQQGEDPESVAAREVEEETGWRPVLPMRSLVVFQPMVSSVDSENHLFLARGAVAVATPIDVNEAELVEWVPLGAVREMIRGGKIVGSASVVGLLQVLLDAS